MRLNFLPIFLGAEVYSAWNDGWSTRWNPVVFAEQGYIVVAVNPTGSTGYGQKFTDAIRGQWGVYRSQQTVIVAVLTTCRWKALQRP